MKRREEEIDVLECALLIAKHAHPDLVISVTSARIPVSGSGRGASGVHALL
jgi:hypothetical protein